MKFNRRPTGSAESFYMPPMACEWQWAWARLEVNVIISISSSVLGLGAGAATAGSRQPRGFTRDARLLVTYHHSPTLPLAVSHINLSHNTVRMPITPLWHLLPHLHYPSN